MQCYRVVWYIKGNTNSNRLSEKNEDMGCKRIAGGFTGRAQGDLGPVYGFQWRHFGAEYKGPDADYEGQVLN
ncbi:unnamed protein product [Cylicocyclus nassatus]|uniref:Thymidylate synthase n=1 Tax=Cylicocyclus nassatus TaxID=53992 RepID=A0AA36GSH0_CYLNA|nr:unnamed protein product [Cylicocyclus nassatus]